MSSRRVWAGLSSEGFTPLSADERAHLESRVKRLSLRLVVGLVAPVLSIGVMVLMLMMEVPELVENVGCLGFGFLLPLVSVMLAEDARARRKGLKRDLVRGEIERFAGVAQVLVSMDPALAKLTRDGSLVTTREHDVRILPESGFVFAIDGAYREDYIKPDVLEVASASAPLREVVSNGELPEPREFMLNAAERGELETRASQLWRTPLPAIGAVAYAALGGIMWVTQDDDWVDRHAGPAVVWVFIGVIGLLGLIRRYRTAMRVGRDAKSGEALESYAKGPGGATRRLVVLKHSKLVWSVDDLPAEWRSKKV